MLGNKNRLYSTGNGSIEKKTLKSQVKNKRLTKLERAQFEVTVNLREILVGLLLGDLCAQKLSANGNTNLHFEQGGAPP